MTGTDEVLRALGDYPSGLTDAQLAHKLGKRPASVNGICHRLVEEGCIVRDGSSGRIINRTSSEQPSPVLRNSGAAPSMPYHEWAWEGNIQDQVVAHLAAGGWTILHTSDTSRRERGDDILAERAGQRLLVEVKGWRTANPSAQAFIAFGEGLAKLTIRGAEPGLRLAMALPDKPRYRVFLGEASWALKRLDITVYLVTAEGSVEIWEREN